ncbi:gamma-glutamyltransferase [soil metagenome]
MDVRQARAAEWEVMAEQCTGRGRRGVFCAAAPLAATACAEVMRVGGNAYDAVVAAALAETVLLPSKCGLGGDLIAITVDAHADVPLNLLAIGGAPAGLSAAVGSGPWEDTGPMSVGPPGAPSGYLALAAKGRLPLELLAARAIELAVDGFPWAAVNHRLTVASVGLLERWNPDGTVFLPDGAPIPAGDLIRLPGLGRALTDLVERGEGFLNGPVGDSIVAAVQARGGVLGAEDFSFARAEWVPCAAGSVESRTLWTTPAPTHGPSLIAAMSLAAARDDLVTQYRRVMAAIAERHPTLTGPSGTSIVSAADGDGNVVVVVHSNSYPRFGSGLVVGEYDLVLGNRAGRGFTPVPGHPNSPVPGRRPETTLHAWVVSGADGRPALAGGTPGGDNQMPWNAQLLQGILDGACEPGVLVTAPRWEWLPADNGVRIEDGFGTASVEALSAVAPRCIRSARWTLASAQQVVAVPEPGRPLIGASDPRTVGSALGV